MASNIRFKFLKHFFILSWKFCLILLYVFFLFIFTVFLNFLNNVSFLAFKVAMLRAVISSQFLLHAVMHGTGRLRRMLRRVSLIPHFLQQHVLFQVLDLYVHYDFYRWTDVLQDFKTTLNFQFVLFLLQMFLVYIV